MANAATPTPSSNSLAAETDSYENVQVVITYEGPYHYAVRVRTGDGDRRTHAVEYVVVNGTTVRFDRPIWFVDAGLDVGVPIDQAGDTAWVWP
ncbi:MAG: hypothetical protein ACOCSN_07175 [Halanaeroarchaeum sp.]